MTYMRWLCSLIIEKSVGDDDLKDASCALFFNGAPIERIDRYARKAGIKGPTESGQELVDWFHGLSHDEAMEIANKSCVYVYHCNPDEMMRFMGNDTYGDEFFSVLFFPDGFPTQVDAAERGIVLDF